MEKVPKGTKSSFFLFFDEYRCVLSIKLFACRAKKKAENPTAHLGNLASEAGEAWKALTPEVKSAYTQTAIKLAEEFRAAHPVATEENVCSCVHHIPNAEEVVTE